ncbi:Uncharacterised protein [Vibrio cholerae]|nr:Uncharacterised protein [Vibrio cholerae]CSC77914.1 Uncharacterised protein [Vibrio cholerae]
MPLQLATRDDLPFPDDPVSDKTRQSLSLDLTDSKKSQISFCMSSLPIKSFGRQGLGSMMSSANTIPLTTSLVTGCDKEEFSILEFCLS